ncbi:hypothetical protein QAD02_003070 [Eretmocerus hayati]|uniref:Uncharacterized protein n=1 Tax=Eretmocerus hayati TaxID=131215 RepID=A0ACC2NL37_9HYME|nr:hypothetical protein QAD02_003070 [Eretmocerus hayati]
MTTTGMFSLWYQLILRTLWESATIDLGFSNMTSKETQTEFGFQSLGSTQNFASYCPLGDYRSGDKKRDRAKVCKILNKSQREWRRFHDSALSYSGLRPALAKSVITGEVAVQISSQKDGLPVCFSFKTTKSLAIVKLRSAISLTLTVASNVSQQTSPSEFQNTCQEVNGRACMISAVMPTARLCCNPFKVVHHNWVTKNVTKSNPSCKKKFPGLGDLICMSCRLLVSKNQEPSSKRVRALVTDSAQDDFAADSAQINDNLTECHEESDPDSVKDSVGLAKRAKDTQKQTGFGSYPPPRQSNTMQSEHTQKVIDFYTSDEISRVMPGMSDALPVAQVDGKRLKLQKRLILCNLKESYASFKAKFPSIKVGFSKFANLRQKQCVLADSSGTHTVCVCKAHQNFELMLDGIKCISDEISFSSYGEILTNMICSEPHFNCYVKKCSNCPGIGEISEEVEGALSVSKMATVSYQPWTNTDRCPLENVVDPVEQFLVKFEKSARDLLTHDFLAKSQSKFLKELKLTLKPRHFIVIGDYSENCSHVIQNAIPQIHWKTVTDVLRDVRETQTVFVRTCTRAGGDKAERL